MKPRTRQLLFCAACCLTLWAAPTALAKSVCSPHWVAAWAGVPSDASRGSDIADMFAPSGENSPGNVKQPVNNASVRAIFTPSVRGSLVRVHLSNRFGSVPVTFARTSIGKQAGGADLAQPPTAVTFRGKPSVTVPPGKDAVSDSVVFSYAAFDNLAVSTYVSGDVGKPTEHYTARQRSYFTTNGAGDHTADKNGSAYSLHNSTRPFVTGLDIRTRSRLGSVVAFGDSITDGYQGQPAGVPETAEGLDANGRYPDVLGRRLRAANLPLSVVNTGISGNRVLRDGGVGNSNRDTNGPAALKRINADVLAQAGATTVIWLEGINDLGQDPAASPTEIIAGYQQGIAKMHAAGLRVLMGTLTPSGGASGAEASYGSAQVNAARQQINDWIRTQNVADGIVDFDAAVRDPGDPSRINPAYDGGDHLHFNLAGYRKMGETVNLAQLRRPPACTATLSVSVSPRTVNTTAGRLTTLKIRVRLAGEPVPGARVRLGNRRITTNAGGQALLRVRFYNAGLRTLVVTAKGASPARVQLRVRIRHAGASNDD
jgi:lysophospholipase L1-like esterase